jgi:hypothetical protein
MRKNKLKSLIKLRSVVLLYLVFNLGGQVSEAADDSTSISLSGDFRYRYEQIDVSDEDDNSRSRHRIRARFGLKAKIADEARVFFQIASGSGDLVSSNQTLSGSFSSKNIVLDLAYAEYQPHALRKRVTLIAGKSKLPFFRPGGTELLWDSDLRPEGLSVFLDLGSDKVDLKVLGGYYILEERQNDANSNLQAGQVVGTISAFPSLSSLKAGVGYFRFTEIQHRTPFFRDDFAGNSSYADTTLPADPLDPPTVTLRHQHEYREIELFFEAGTSWNERPILLMADYVVNTEPDMDDTGWLLGLKLGRVLGRGTWALRYNYRRLEKDAVYGTFTDSNFGGGGTDGKGHEMGVSYGPFKNSKITLSYFHNWSGINDGDKYQRWMLDVSSIF